MSRVGGLRRPRQQPDLKAGPRASCPQQGLQPPLKSHWQLPSAEDIAFSPQPLAIQVDLPHPDRVYVEEADAMRYSFPEVTWSRAGKPDKVCLGPRCKQNDWERFRSACPAILEAAEHLIASFSGQCVEVTFGDVLDYQRGHLLGWHQDNMDLQRHLFTAVLTLASSGDGRCEWRQISSDGSRLEDVVASSMPCFGNLAIHGLSLGCSADFLSFFIQSDNPRRQSFEQVCLQRFQGLINWQLLFPESQRSQGAATTRWRTGFFGTRGGGSLWFSSVALRSWKSCSGRSPGRFSSRVFCFVRGTQERGVYDSGFGLLPPFDCNKAPARDLNLS